ncbi:DUF4328 domain-containing protein [Streptomyces sp. NPDC058691]|uniref:DUF4328 domain-containing protein n=1 Tax=Streptomyces sp. NPDC058691 TaxID=3346601 RepID=UPI0036570263
MLLAVALLADVLAVFAAVRTASLAGDILHLSPDVTDDRIRSVNDFHKMAGWVQKGSLLAAAVPFVAWFHRARLNAEVFAPAAMRTTPSWAISGWVVPVLNLWMGRKIANDIDRATLPPSPDGPPADRPGSKPTGPTRLLLNTWWTLWIGSIWGGFLYTFVAEFIYLEGSTDMDDYAVAITRIDAFGEAIQHSVSVFAAIAAALVVRRITALQRTRATTFLSLQSA